MERDAARRAQLVEAALREIGAAGSLEVPVGRIAKRAGVSAGLAFHYFGDKERLFLAAMRHILRLYGDEVRRVRAAAATPRARLDALIGASFATHNFAPEVIGAWLTFYVRAKSSPEARRLLAVYHRRLRSTLIHDLRPLVGARAPDVAERMGGLIDGLYLRHAIRPAALSAIDAAAHVRESLDAEIAAAAHPRSDP